MIVVRQIMGMPITIDIPESNKADDFELVFNRLHQINNRFSPYKNSSEVSKYQRGLISESQLSTELRYVIEQSKKAQINTRGYFSAWAAGKFDPSGYVKGWAISQAAKVIEQNGFNTYCICAGGDILASSDSGKVWNIGIQDPTKAGCMLDTLTISNGAVATSGNYERGAHIYNPKTKTLVNDLASVTISGPDIIWADVLATAVFAMGAKGKEFMKSQINYVGLIVENSLGSVAREVISPDIRRVDIEL